MPAGPFTSTSHTRPAQLLSWLPPHLHGLQPLSFGLFHQQEAVRDFTVDLFNALRGYPVRTSVLFPDNTANAVAR